VIVEAFGDAWLDFFGFGGDCSDQGSPCVLAMDQDRSVTAFFGCGGGCGGE